MLIFIFPRCQLPTFCSFLCCHFFDNLNDGILFIHKTVNYLRFLSTFSFIFCFVFEWVTSDVWYSCPYAAHCLSSPSAIFVQEWTISDCLHKTPGEKKRENVDVSHVIRTSLRRKNIKLTILLRPRDSFMRVRWSPWVIAQYQYRTRCLILFRNTSTPLH